MTRPDSTTLAGDPLDLLQRTLDQVLDHALNGIGPLPSAADLAGEYRRRTYKSDAGRVRALIRWATAKNAATGFVTGLGGLLALPVAVPSSLAASLAIQASMVAAIAEVYGHDSKDDRVRTTILLCMLGNGLQDVTKHAAVVTGQKIAIESLKALPGKVLIEINKKLGFRLLTKFGQKGVVNLAKLVPVVGGVVGGAFDGTTCYTVGRLADRVFRPTARNEVGAKVETSVELPRTEPPKAAGRPHRR